ncbi:MAG: hypothetical protein L6V93_09530 [Clostridiales bacterium]|nr:MAG: hypothetical protein L6V93_09530 [Clostridiales bacterium]
MTLHIFFKRSEKPRFCRKINAEKDFDAPVEKGKVGGSVEIVSNGKNRRGKPCF